MPSTFNVIFLDKLDVIDPIEGNTLAENAEKLVTKDFGDVGDPLFSHIHTLTPGTTSFLDDGNPYYNQNDETPETFRIDDGPEQGFDAAASYQATITYSNGKSAQISAVIFQDTEGNTYLAPEYEDPVDQAALEAGPIVSLTLDALLVSSADGMAGDRLAADFAVCFVAGTTIATPYGPRAIEDLAVGDLVTTQDNGDQPIRWIGSSKVRGAGKRAPVRIQAGALGPGLPYRDLLVSWQHRMLVQSRIAERMTGNKEVLVPAKQLLDLPGVSLDLTMHEVTYLHILFDNHEIIFAENTPAESLLPGPMALEALNQDARDEISALFPELPETLVRTARPVPKGHVQRGLISRHLKNEKHVLQHWPS